MNYDEDERDRHHLGSNMIGGLTLDEARKTDDELYSKGKHNITIMRSSSDNHHWIRIYLRSTVL